MVCVRRDTRDSVPYKGVAWSWWYICTLTVSLTHLLWYPFVRWNFTWLLHKNLFSSPILSPWGVFFLGGSYHPRFQNSSLNFGWGLSFVYISYSDIYTCSIADICYSHAIFKNSAVHFCCSHNLLLTNFLKTTNIVPYIPKCTEDRHWPRPYMLLLCNHWLLNRHIGTCTWMTCYEEFKFWLLK